MPSFKNIILLIVETVLDLMPSFLAIAFVVSPSNMSKEISI